MGRSRLAGHAGADAQTARRRFLDFELVPHARALLFDGARVPLGSRAFDILAILVEQAGRLVSCDELIRRVWPDTVVVRGNLRVHISALRKALREQQDGRICIETIPAHGYLFSPAVRIDKLAPARPPAADMAQAHTPAARPLIGRERELRDATRALLATRFITITGGAGVGKSALALAVAALAGARLDSPVCLIAANHDGDLDGSLDGALRAIASALGLPADDELALLRARLHGARALVVLDDCDHGTAAARALAEALRAALPSLWLLATGRAPLRAAGETPLPLLPLALPPKLAALSAAQAGRYAAVRLFCECARDCQPGFTLRSSDVAAISAICRELDGVPLAIVLAALNVDWISPAELLDRLGERFEVLAAARRGAPARHQSMWAAIDWGYARLSRQERLVVGRLSLLHDEFTHGCAAAVVCCADITPAGLAALLKALVDKSVLLAETGGSDGTRYRLLNTTRAYARVVRLA